MKITKEIISYPLYDMGNGFKAKVTKDNKVIIITPMETEIKLEDLNAETKAIVQPMLDFIEADINHKFEFISDEEPI